MSYAENAATNGTSLFVINNRSLAASNAHLASLLKPGMKVLDLGCGTGAITNGIAEAVSPGGSVIGIDRSPDFIEKAKVNYQAISNLRFEVGDIYNLPFDGEFDLVTASRLLQWLPDAPLAVENMVRAAKIGGKIVVLDYNHEKYRVEPPAPASMVHFLQVYLDWRRKAGMDMEVADHLADLFQSNGLAGIIVTPQHEIIHRGETGFENKIRIRAEVVADWGRVMVRQGVISEEERSRAETDYLNWIEYEAQSQFLYLLSVEGIRTS
ncbi:MAG: methyltransferase domain-containing protein [Chloroflexi bacterium]|nr:methyltransferase domain-containing protein [Chloroflexota bacterium]